MSFCGVGFLKYSLFERGHKNISAGGHLLVDYFSKTNFDSIEGFKNNNYDTKKWILWDTCQGLSCLFIMAMHIDSGTLIYFNLIQYFPKEIIQKGQLGSIKKALPPGKRIIFMSSSIKM